GFGAYWSGSEIVIPNKGDLRDYWIKISFDMDFLGPTHSYVHIRDPVRRLCHKMITCSISGRGQGGKKYLFRHADGRKSGARLSRGYFIRRLAAYFGLVSDEGLRERQQAAVAGAPRAAEDAPAADEGAQAVPAPVQAPQPPPPAPQHRTMSQWIERLEEEVHELRQSVVGLRGVVESSITEQTRVSTWMISLIMEYLGKIWYDEDDLDLRSVETEFPAIVFNDSLTSNETPSCEPTVSSPNDKIDFRISSDESDDEDYTGKLVSKNGYGVLGAMRHMALPPRDQRHQYLRYEGLQYTDVGIADFETRLARIYRREINRVQVFDFGGLLDLMAEGLSARMLMEHRDAQGQRLHLVEEMQTAGFGLYWTESARRIPDKGDLRDYWIRILSARDFLGTAPSYTFNKDPMLRLCHRLIACSIAGRSQAPEKGLTVITHVFPIIDMAELVKLQLCIELDDTWAWVPTGPARQEGGAGGVAEEALVAPGGGDEDEEMPQAVPPPPRTQGERIARLEEEVHGVQEAL
ncbi:hypothetical protein Tco_1024021, partial [Tanacetum coccineum]